MMEILVALLAGVGVTVLIWRRRAKRNRASGVFECGVRDRSGATSRLVRRWRHGRATPSPGHISFEPFLPFGVRFRRWRTPAIPIDVLGLELGVRRISGLESVWATGVVHELTTPAGPIELVMGIYEDPAWIVERLLSDSSS